MENARQGIGRPTGTGNAAAEPGIAAMEKQVLGTKVEIKLPIRHSPFFPLCFSELERIEKAYSRFLPGSELTRLNGRLGIWQDASQELLALVEMAGEFKTKTDGNFDITLKSRLDDLGYDSQYSFERKKPGMDILGAFRRFLPAIKTDQANGKILLNRQIEFGGLGKGYALDCVARLLEKNCVEHYYINAGGDIYARKGKSGAEKPWEILLEHPDDPERAIGKISLDGKSIAGSAPNRRKWGDSHHLLNARTGMPARGVKCIFIIAKTGIEADAYATALFTAGFEQGIGLSKKLPVEILVVSSQDKMYQSPGFGAELFG